MGIKTALLDLIATGRLTGADLAFDGQPLAAAPVELWRPDGYSTAATEYGARSHKDIDAHLNALMSGDDVQRRVAERSPRYFAFHFRHGHLIAENTEAAERAQWAYSDIVPIAGWLGNSPGPWDFRLLASDHGIEGQHYYFPERHAIVFDRISPEEWPAFFINLTNQRIEAERANPWITSQWRG